MVHTTSSSQVGIKQHRTIEAVRGKINDKSEPEDRDARKRHPRNAGGNRGIEHGNRDQRCQCGEPRDGDVRVTNVPARQIEIGEEKNQQRRRQNCLTAGAPYAFGAGRHVEHFAPEAEVDADIDQYGPAECGCGRKHDRAFHDEEDREKQREQTSDADDDAVIQSEGIDLVLVRVGLPQIDLRKFVGTQFGNEGDYGARVERDAKYIGGRAFLTDGTIAGRGCDGRDAR